ncbi:hypothetical protein [Zavarzinia sp.]|uniref:hypothetical protein n=1 Tax=Zavarzinia sp. TaxID=2027920 RepID=UPI00356695D0
MAPVVGKFRIVFATFCLGTAGCSPYVYKDEVGGFQQQVSRLASTYDDSVKQYGADYDRERRQHFAVNLLPLETVGGCQEVSASGPPCQIVTLSAKDADTYPATSPYQDSGPDATKKVLGALAAYAAQLVAITDAADSEALAARQKSLWESVGKVLKTADQFVPGAADTSGMVGTAGGLLGKLLQAALDRERLAALRQAVTAVDPRLPILAHVAEEGIKVLIDSRLRSTSTYLDEIENRSFGPDVVKRLNVELYDARYSALSEAVAEINALRAVKPADLTQALVDAHHALATALDNKNADLASVTAALANLAEKVSAFRDAIEAANKT